MSKRTKESANFNSWPRVAAFVAALILVVGLSTWATSPKAKPAEPANTTPQIKAIPVEGVTPMNPKLRTPKIGNNSFIRQEVRTELKSLKSDIFATYYYEAGNPSVKIEWDGMMFTLDEEFSQIGDWNIRLAGYNEQGAVLESDPLPY